MAGMRVDRVYAGISGEHISANRSVGVVAVSAREIVRRDVKRVHAVARAVPEVIKDRELLHAIPQNYVVDNQGGIKDPVGMSGTRLETELYLVTGCSAVVGNVVRARSRGRGYRVQDAVLESIAASRAVLAEDERELGVAMVDMGGATTGPFGSLRGKDTAPRGAAVRGQRDHQRPDPGTRRALRRRAQDQGAPRRRPHARGIDRDAVVKLPSTNGSPRRITREMIAGADRGTPRAHVPGDRAQASRCPFRRRRWAPAWCSPEGWRSRPESSRWRRSASGPRCGSGCRRRVFPG